MPDLSSQADAAGAAPAQVAPDAALLKSLVTHCQKYRGGIARRSIVQLGTTVALFLAAISTMFVAFHHGVYWLYALLMVPAGGLVVRLFIIQHDCGHGSFFKSKAANDWTGRFLSLFTFIPYGLWRRGHNLHHAGSGNLDRRGAGDIDTLTIAEYKALSPKQQFWYRLYRHPLVLLVIAPPIYILVLLRFPPWQSVPFLKNYNPLPAGTQGWGSVMGLNVALAAIYGGLIYWLGWKTGLLVYLPVVATAFWIGQWLFYIQHQYEDAYWRHKDGWNYNEAAIYGSSYYVLPKVLQWFTGNIGFHHIHHLCPGIPNYRLEECFRTNADLAKAPRLTLQDSLKSIHLALWDEMKMKMVSFREAV